MHNGSHLNLASPKFLKSWKDWEAEAVRLTLTSSAAPKVVLWSDVM
jgi:hypothetical protein